MAINGRESRFSLRVIIGVIIVALLVVGGGITAVLQLTNRGPAVGTAEFDKQTLCRVAAEVDGADTTEFNLRSYEVWLFDATSAFGTIVAMQDDTWVPTAKALAETHRIADEEFARTLAAIGKQCEADGIKFASNDPDLAADAACAYIDYFDDLPASDIESLAKDELDLRRLQATSALFSADYLIHDEIEDSFKLTDLRGQRIISALHGFDDDALRNEALPEVRSYCEAR